MDDTLIAVFTTLPDEAGARALAEALVRARLAACVQLHAIASVYEWDGAVQHDAEWRLLAKARATDWPALRDFIAARHPYRLPAIWRAPIEASDGYAAWVRQQTARPPAA
ncbi:Divalent-cation tolerance protein CutA [Tepidimonas sediminis]|uniref:Divalent-cation tolerance protein CutA n=1 Tax=Tepidimonas sediminis TaxID=2588941 RepID=A0A554WTJ2_9BURK|nr:divalent-cation tolerance protein CutA [Tepidimonas sediminis]TSE26902.1 Divalent-cation tolerance protein CutA [Tepidimonas sediminis]